MARLTTQRRVFQRALRPYLSDQEPDMDEMKLADEELDASLSILDYEEPSLREWLSSDQEIMRLLKANTSAMHALIMTDYNKGFRLDYTVARLDALVFRVACAVAWKAALRER